MTGESERERESAVLLTQYQQVCEDLRQLDRLLWQIPSLVTLIGGTLVVAVFTFMRQYGAPLPAREGVLGIALLLMVTMSFILLRHRYCGIIAVGTLSKLEGKLKVQHVQRTPFPKEFDDMHPESKMYPSGLHYDAKPTSIWKHGAPGPKSLFWVMLFMALIIVVLMIYIIVQPDTVKSPSCLEKTFAWVIFSLSILSTSLVFLARLSEVKNIQGDKTKIQRGQRKKRGREKENEDRSYLLPSKH